MTAVRESTALVPASSALAARFLTLVAALRRFNADQVALRESWLRHHGLPAYSAPGAPSRPIRRF